MRRVWLVLTLAALVTVASIAPCTVAVRDADAQDLKAGQTAGDAARKVELAEQVMASRQVAGKGPLAAAYMAYWVERLATLPVAQLEELALGVGETDLTAILPAEQERTFGAALPIEPKALGDSGSDLVFTKLPPCRIVDTRNAGGMLSNGGSRSFYAVSAAGFAFQGGSPTDCGVPYGATAVAINIGVGPATGTGWLRTAAYNPVSPPGEIPTASVINYGTTPTYLSNGIVQPICDPAVYAGGCPDYDFTVIADAAGGHLFFDITGYFMKVNKAQFRSFVVESSTSASAVPIGTTCQSFGTITITAPVSGRIEVVADAKLQINGHAPGGDELIWLNIGASATDCAYSVERSGRVWLDNPMPAGDYHLSGSTYRMFDVTAGTYTYHITSTATGSGAGSSFFQVGGLRARFFPY